MGQLRDRMEQDPILRKLSGAAIRTRVSRRGLNQAISPRKEFSLFQLLARHRWVRALQGIALIGDDDFSSQCQRYATSLFKVPPITAEFLQSVLPRKQELAD